MVEGWETLEEPVRSVTGGQSTALVRLTDAFVGRGPPSAGQAEPRRSTAFSPKSGYKVGPTDKMVVGRGVHKKRKRTKRSRAFIDPEDFVIKESRFGAMFEIAFPAMALGKSPQGLRYTTQPVGSLHGLGTSPSAATHPAGPGRFQNVVDGAGFKQSKPPRKRHRKPSVAKMVRGTLKGS